MQSFQLNSSSFVEEFDEDRRLPQQQAKVSAFGLKLSDQRMKRNEFREDDQELITLPPPTAKAPRALGNAALGSRAPNSSSRSYTREDFGEGYGQQYHSYRRPQREPEFALRNELQARPVPLNEDVETVEVSRGQLNSAMKSKLDIYRILAIEGQMYLPPFKDCSMDFLKGVINGTKKVPPPLLSHAVGLPQPGHQGGAGAQLRGARSDPHRRAHRGQPHLPRVPAGPQTDQEASQPPVRLQRKGSLTANVLDREHGRSSLL